MLYTTLKLLRKANACSEGMATLTKSLGPSYIDSQEIPLSHILESNGLNHAIWAMQATTVNCKQQIVELATKFAFESLGNFEKQFPNDSRPRQAIEAADLFMQGKITLEQLSAAESAARSAGSAGSAAWSAAESAWSAAESAGSAAESAGSAAWSAAESARSARSAAWSAAGSAGSAAWSAAESAARSAGSAESARSARSAAWSARSAAEKRQRDIFLLVIS